MGGSSAPPGDIWRAHHKRRKDVLDLERRQRFLDLRNELLRLRAFCERCDQSVIAKDFAVMSLQHIERTIRRMEEPDRERQMELEDWLVNRVVPLGQELRKRGWTPYAQQLSRALYDRFREAYRNERHRQHLADTETPTDFTSREEMQAYVDRLIEEGRLEPMRKKTAYLHLKHQAEAFGLYLPSALRSSRPPRPRLTEAQVQTAMRVQRVREHTHYAPAMFRLFGFEPPRSTMEEHRLLHSPLLKAQFRQLAKRWHPDTGGGHPVVRAYWWSTLLHTWQALQTHKRWLGTFVPLMTHEVFETRTPEQMRQAEPPRRRGLMLR